ncbi:LysR family transcriptional regulator [Burkholderia plantarii]|uniref:LysR family transcriptional regulator n=1 Tax=Burkholderia plantarii TaxID=41899 RepID=UPI0006D8CE2C|nr:LysR family transcriptional regulator [Burkholderia plantarii]ALK34786.1 LysR family transcriptional regulator [Burkholderia plantarii]WLE63807.1 LysR family transcriptional regulator [Burkholderia plantarii]GLZ18781.1 LysR family transcriptional regulator [Burkholderia plantarii]
MDIRYVQSFVAVLECGSIAEAARRLDLTATAVAARIHSLEEALGARLIRRSGRRVVPTADGLRILDSAHAVLHSVRDLQAIAQDGRTQFGELRLGVFVSAMVSVLPSVLQRVYAAYPDLKLFVEPGASVELCRKVGTGELDVAIVVEPQFTIPKTCEWRSLTEEPLVVVAPARLAGRDAHELLRGEPFIRYDRAVLGGQLAERYLRDHDLHPRQRLEIDGLLAIAALVDKGLGVSLLPDWPSLWTSGLAIARIPLPERAPVRRIGLIIARHTPRFPLAQALAHEAAELFRPAGAGEPAVVS